jgi:fructose-1,6-bisphosphatase/sedoheptulose 1,7-bisphosphatase-like protein
MDLFTIDNLSLDEIAVLRQALNVIEIKGSSAQFIANLQNKLDNEINQIKLLLLEEENKKQAGIAKIEKANKANS